MGYTYNYPRPSLTVDCSIFASKAEKYYILLIQRGNYPYKGEWALPGGFVDMDEDLIDAAKRELKEETGLIISHLEQLHTFGTPNRDPRGRTVSVVYFGITEFTDKIKGDDDATKADWFPIDQLPKLAFDHAEIIEMAIQKLLDR